MALFGRNKALLGLDIGTSTVKAVELSRVGSGLVISGMASATFETQEQLPTVIPQMLKDAGISTKRVCTSVSGRSVIIRQVQIAQVPDNELRQAIQYEADKYIPFDVAEVQLDAQRLPEDEAKGGQMKVLLVAVKRNLVDEQVALLQSAGLEPVIVDVDCFALGNAFELRNLSLGINDLEVRALVDIGASKTNINIMRGNLSLFQREIYVAGNDLTEAVAKRFGEDPKDVERMKKDPGGALESMQDAMLPVLEDIGNEIKLSFDYFQNQYESEVKEVYLSGGSAYFPGIDTMFTQIFNLPTRVWDPTEGMEIRTSMGVGGTNSDMTVALGLASRILSTGAYVARAASTSQAETAEAVESPTRDVRRAVFVTPAAVKKAWAQGIVFGLGAAIAAAVGCAMLPEPFAFNSYVVLLEALPLGLISGIGLWMGIKSLRPVASKASLILASLVLSLVCTGTAVGVRTATGKPLFEVPKSENIKQKMTIDKVNIEGLPPELVNTQVFAKEPPGMDVGKASSLGRVGTHWLLVLAICLLFVNSRSNAVTREENRSNFQV